MEDRLRVSLFKIAKAVKYSAVQKIFRLMGYKLRRESGPSGVGEGQLSSTKLHDELKSIPDEDSSESAYSLPFVDAAMTVFQRGFIIPGVKDIVMTAEVDLINGTPFDSAYKMDKMIQVFLF